MYLNNTHRIHSFNSSCNNVYANASPFYVIRTLSSFSLFNFNFYNYINRNSLFFLLSLVLIHCCLLITFLSFATGHYAVESARKPMHAKQSYRCHTLVASSLGPPDIRGSEPIHADHSWSVKIDIPEAPSLYTQTECVQNTANTGSLCVKNSSRTRRNELLSERVLELPFSSAITIRGRVLQRDSSNHI
jgi:hypothetical protein